MNLDELVQTLQLFLPLIGQLSNHEQAAQLVNQLIQIGQVEADRIASEKGQTRDEVIADATATWAVAIAGADDLAQMGH